ncbi:Cyclic AMP receptor 2 [Hyphodiscus hymeniophilus]|uniref:Cyclic AMP receptor 2 n=1 Tax=Hyphodiscus hymeniophilus TaxID=353542 RepID=A0A9P6VMI3_9HELO|nr:Cyclic AMP receptor 2 [Hyphodiscus hymeniophilus]
MAVLSPSQIWACAIAERVSSSISLVSTLTMFVCYFSIKRFRSLLSNRLLIIASIANLACNAATLIGGSGLADVNSSVCQAQAFLLEWFMQTDPAFGTCMAFDVYLVMFRRWTYGQVKSVFKWYIPICYGLPLIPALVCLVWRGSNNTMIYGNAGIWCWIDDEFAYVRIYSYYGPVWIYLMITFVIYIRVGYEIFAKRSALRAFGTATTTPSSLITRSRIQHRGRGRSSRPNTRSPSIPALTGLRTTEVEITTSQSNLAIPVPIHLRPSHTRQDGNFVNISANVREPRRSLLNPRDWYAILLRSFTHLDKVTVAYCKCAGLFSLSILITWVPSSANRVYGLKRPHDPSYALNLAAAAVLPLQGFWNTTIFFWTSWSIVETEFHELRRIRAHNRGERHYLQSQIRLAEHGYGGIKTKNRGDTESTKEVLEDEEDLASTSYNTGKSSIRTIEERLPGP